MTTKTWNPKDFCKRIRKDFNLTYFICLAGWVMACLLFSKPINSLASSIGKTLFLGSGKHSQTSWLEFVNITPRVMGLRDLTSDDFGVDDYYTDWMDTTESQQLLQFQNLGLEAYKRELAYEWRYKRFLILPFRWLIRRYMLSFSPAHKK